MNFTMRSLGLALLLLLVFLGATITLQWWLRRETRQLQLVAVEEARNHLTRAIAVSGRPPEKWDAEFVRELGIMLGGTVTLARAGAPSPAVTDNRPTLAFTETVPGSTGWQVRAVLSPPALLKVQVLHQRVIATMVLLSLLFALVPILLVILAARRAASGEPGTRSPWEATRAQAVGIEHFAKISNERGAALVQEQGARLRAEEDLQLNRTLLDNSVAERVRLGRELHDNVSQTLYAVCLTLESVQKKGALAGGLQARVDHCMRELRRLNQEVRAFLQELEPARVTSGSFASALTDLMASISVGQEVQIEHRLDDEAVALIAPVHIAEIMNIIREAVSNSLRHGNARRILLRAGRSDQAVALAVQDDGAGFETSRLAQTGHGLGNMRARAAALGATLRIESAVGKGTRVLLTLPVPSSS